MMALIKYINRLPVDDVNSYGASRLHSTSLLSQDETRQEEVIIIFYVLHFFF